MNFNVFVFVLFLVVLHYFGILACTDKAQTNEECLPEKGKVSFFSNLQISSL